MSTKAFLEQLVTRGWLEMSGDKPRLTETGKRNGGELRVSPKFGPYFLWPRDLKL